MKGLRFGDTQESCFEGWKRSYMSCSALLYGRFADSQESLLHSSKLCNIRSAFLENVRYADIHELCFHAAERSKMDCVKLQGGLFVD